jgi:hypothetical protein
MAGPWFVRSAAVGTGDGLSWANAKTTVAAAATASSAGDKTYVADDHAETQGSAMTITFPGTNANPSFIYCADHTVALPGTGDLKTTGSVSTTGAFSITFNGSFYCYGLIIAAGSGAVAANIVAANTGGNSQIFEACAMRLNGTNVGVFQIGFDAACEWRNTTFQVGNAGSSINPGNSCRFTWKIGSILGVTVPTSLIAPNNQLAIVYIEGVDLSNASGTLVSANPSGALVLLKDCKLPASITRAATPTMAKSSVDMVRCDSAGTNYWFGRYRYQGTQIPETSIIRTGGAVGPDGTGISHKITTTANSKWVMPFECEPFAINNLTTGSNRTVTVYGTINAGAVPNNDDVWIEVEYLGASGSPLGSFATATKMNNLATGSALTADGSTWGGGGSGAGWSPFSISVTLSSPQPQLKGYFYVTVKAAKVSTTFYIDPKPILS